MNRVFRALAIVAAAAITAQAVPLDAYRSYARGLMAARAGDMQSAAAEYEQVVRLDAGAVQVYRELAHLYWQLGRNEEAFAAADRLRQANAGDLQTELFLGSFYLLTGQTNMAREAWERVLAIDPNNENAILYLAAYHSSDNRPDRALDYWNKYIAQKPDSAEGYYQLGLTQEKLGLLGNARESFRKNIALNPANPDAHLALAQLYEKEGKIGAAEQEYEKYLELVPDNMTVLMYLGGLYYRSQNFDLAESIFLRAQKLKPEDAAVIYWLGVLAEEKKDWPAAIAYFETLRAKEETAGVLTRLSYYYSVQKKHGKAIACLKKVVQLEPQNPNARYLLGLAYMESHQNASAERALRDAVTMKADFTEAWFHLGMLYDQWGKFDRAVTELKHTIERDPNHAAALNYLGYSYADRGINLAEAEQLLLRALAIEPENASFLDSLGWVYFKQQRYAEAEVKLAAAAQKLPDPVVWEHLGDTYAAQESYAAAWEAYRNAWERVPKKRSLRKKMGRAEQLSPAGAIPRLILQRARENLAAIQSVRVNFTAAGEARDAKFRFIGICTYGKPDRWRIDVIGGFMAPQLTIIQNQALSVIPRSLESSFTPESLRFLARAGEYLTGDILADFAVPGAVVRKQGGMYTYTAAGATVVIDALSGVINEYRNDAGLLLRFRRSAVHDGVDFPAEIAVAAAKDGITATVTLQNLQMNRPLDPAVFTVPQTEAAP